MTKICPSCNHSCADDDIFCPKCGQKLYKNNVDIDQINESLSDSSVMQEIKNSIAVRERRISEFFSASKVSFVENPLFTFLIYLIIMSIVVVLILFFILNNHSDKKARLDYRNMIENPALIPKVSDTKSYTVLLSDFIKTQDFLEKYFKYSRDSLDKKEQIFSRFLKELDKLTYISTVNMDTQDIKYCSDIDSYVTAKKCASNLNKKFKNSAVNAVADYNAVYLYPDSKFIKKRYSKYLSDEFRNYIALRAKYNRPVSIGLNLKVSPKTLANKIDDFEKFYNSANDLYIKESIEAILYNDMKKFIFTPSIYATTTQEMSNKYKNAYMYYINFKHESSFRPIIMSVLEKGKGYSEDNFKSDYPYKIHELNFDENVQNSSFSDIFAALRKGFFNSSDKVTFQYVYNSIDATFEDYRPNQELKPSQFLFGAPDENNNVPIYTSTYSPFQELNINKYSQFFLSRNKLYTYNEDRLSITQILYNGRIFTSRTLSPVDISSLFPGINVINIDSYKTYNIVLNKDNSDAGYIIVSKYSQGFAGYGLDSLRGTISRGKLPNMFSVSTNGDTIVSFHSRNIEPDETSENTPTYKILIRTGVLSENGDYIQDEESDIAQYDRETEIQQNREVRYQERRAAPKPNMMPKIQSNTSDIDVDEPPMVPNAPRMKIDPPVDIE